MIYDVVVQSSNFFIKEKSGQYPIPLERRIFDFVIQVIKYVKLISKSNINSIIIYQLTKSATSIGANFQDKR